MRDSSPEQESLRVQLAELNGRSRAYTAQIWQIPFAYLGIVGVVLAQVADKTPRITVIALFAAAVFGVVAFVHLTAMMNGVRRAVEAIVKVERQLKLEETAQYRPWWYISPLAAVVVLAVIACLVGGIYFCSLSEKPPGPPNAAYMDSIRRSS